MLARDYRPRRSSSKCVRGKIWTPSVLGIGPHLKVFHEALLAVARGGAVAARSTLEHAERELETRLSQKVERTDEAYLRADLALIFSFLGRREEAIREALRAVDLKSAPPGSPEANYLSSALAMVYAQNGEPEKAIPLIEHLLTVPCELPPGAIYNMTLADLKWRWQSDPLRNHPRFQKLMAGPEPRTVY